MTWRRALALATAVALTGCRPAPQAPVDLALVRTAVPAAAADSHEEGRRIWNFRCYYCHGYSGDARTLAASFLSPPPRDFTGLPPGTLSLAALQQAITHGRPGTAMKGFAGILTPRQVAAVAGFVQREFIEGRAQNTRYHTADNGWPDHQRYREAFGFARGELALDTPWEQLDAAQQRGKRLYMAACISCHDHGRVVQPGAVWETRALSYPRDAYCTSCHASPQGPGDPGPAPRAAAPSDAGVATVYSLHDRPPMLSGLDAHERRGESLYQRNCAFCHAADGTAGSWIGRFLEPHPRDLTDPAHMAGMSRQRLKQVIAEGLEGSSMPAWRSVLSPVEIDAVAAYVHRAFHPLTGR